MNLSEVRNFRVNFDVGLQADGRSLHRFAADVGMSAAHLSRVRSGVPPTGFKGSLVPGLDACERIAVGLGYKLRDLLLPVSEFEALVRVKHPNFKRSRLQPQFRPKPRQVQPRGPRKKVKA